uniref:AMP-binding protein n=1 Tax=Oceanobacillus sp. AG TaxID=2681969 RepID=UPI001E598FD8
MSKYFPLTEAQKRIWYTDALFPRTATSNVVVKTEFKNLDEELLKKSIDLFVSHNDIIRVRLLKQHDQEPVQYISNEPLISTKVLDLSIYSENQLNLWFQEQAKQPIPLYESNLYEFTIINWHDKSFLLVKCHHIIIDGVSIDALLLNIRSIYESLRSHSEINHLSKYTLHQYTTSEKEYKQSARFQKDNHFWQSEFESIPEYLIEKTNALYSRSLQAKRKEYKIPDTTKNLIEKFCQENQISIYTFLMSVLFIYFSRTENENDFVIGTYLANRKRKENDVLGMFVSTLPFRMEVFNEIQTLEFIKSLSKKQMKLMRHQKYPYNQLIQDLRKKGNDINQLFTVGVEYQEMEADFHQVFSGHDFNGMNFHIKNYTLKEQLVINIDYRTELFPDYEIEYLIGRLFVLIRDIIQFPEKNIGELSVCTKEERGKILNEFNDTEMPYPKEKTIHSLFEEQVEKDPHQVAVVFQEKQLTYKELNERANRLARILRQRGVTSEDRVGLLMERSLDMIVGMLAILKAGGAYLPIDPAYPAERIDYMLEDSGSKIVLSQTKVIEQLWEEKQWESDCLDVRKIDFEGIDESNLMPVNQSRNLAYVMYTSGTTGRPKGVEVIHQNVVRLVKETNYATLNEKQVLLQLASIAFDASTFEIWGGLLNGAKLVMIGSNRPTLEEIAFTLEHEKITTMFLTTALFNTMVDHQLMALKGVQQLLMGGETVSVSHVKKALSLNSLQLVHVYGPTENTTFSSYYVVPETWEEESTIPIGKPINNTKIFILNEMF